MHGPASLCRVEPSLVVCAFLVNSRATERRPEAARASKRRAGSTGHRRSTFARLGVLTSLPMRWLVVFIALLGLSAVPRMLAQAPRVRPGFAVEIAQGNSLMSDGMGPYRDGEKGLFATGNVAE